MGVGDGGPGQHETLSLQITLLGGFRVAIGDRRIPEAAWPLQKARSLVKLLALTPGHRLARDQILDTLWPEMPLATAAQNLYSTLTVLRRVLAPVAPLRLWRGTLALDTIWPVAVDVADFEAAAATARRTADPADYAAALAHYRGELLPDDRYEEWVLRRREALRALYHDLLLDLAGLQRRQGRQAAAVATLRQLVADEPTHEVAQVELMHLYAQAGQRGLAVQQYQRFHAALARHLDAEPEAATRQLFGAILAGGGVDVPASADLGTAHAPARDLPERPDRPHNLPAPLTSFLGRAQEVAEVCALLADDNPDPRLLTLTGAGGCGKTRLALAVAHAVSTMYPDGVWLIELAALRDPALVVAAIATVLAVRADPQPPLASLIQALQTKRVLLVLDNCEHLLAEVAAVAAALLAGCPGLRVLATSRVALRVPGEMTWRVPSLAVPPPRPPGGAPTDLATLHATAAVQLFVVRARQRQPDFALTEANAPAVVEICRRLDGLPLALELAAGRIAALTVRQIAARLDDALGLLTDGGRIVPDRQQTIRATLDWSYTLLAPEERALLARLAVFVGGFTLDAVEAVCAESVVEPLAEPVQAGQYGPGVNLPTLATPFDALAALIDASLVQVREDHDQARYELLELVGQFAAEQLAGDGAAAMVRDRHAAWVLALGEAGRAGLAGPQEARWRARLALEQANTRAAFTWFTANERFEEALRLAIAAPTDIPGFTGEARRWMGDILARSEAVPGPLRAQALDDAAGIAWRTGDYPQAADLYGAARALFRELGDERGEALTLYHLGMVADSRGDAAGSTDFTEASLVIFRRIGDERGAAHALHGLGVVALRARDWERGAAYAAEELALFVRLGNQRGIAMAHNLLGLLTFLQGAAGLARSHFATSLRLFAELAMAWGIAQCLEGLGGVAVAGGDARVATQLFGAAEALREAAGAPLVMADREWFDPLVAAARARLDATAFTACWAAGRALPLAEVIALALGDDW